MRYDVNALLTTLEPFTENIFWSFLNRNIFTYMIWFKHKFWWEFYFIWRCICTAYFIFYKYILYQCIFNILFNIFTSLYFTNHDHSNHVYLTDWSGLKINIEKKSFVVLTSLNDESVQVILHNPWSEYKSLV